MKNGIDFNVISVHITKEGNRDFVIVDFDWYGSRKTLNIPFNKFTGIAHEQIFRMPGDADDRAIGAGDAQADGRSAVGRNLGFHGLIISINSTPSTER